MNTFLSEQGSPTIIPTEVIRSTAAEKDFAIDCRDRFQARNHARAPQALSALQATSIEHGNIFESLMEASKVCTLGQISDALYRVGGQYRRNM